MMARLFFLATLFLVLGPLDGAAQDDRPWWKQLINAHPRPEKPVEVVPEAGAMDSPNADAEPANDEGGDDGAADSEVEISGLPKAQERGGIQGTVQWDISEQLMALDSVQVDPEAIRIPGYRVQIFMGRLDSARSLRRHLQKEVLTQEPVYVTPYPPLFGVTLGNFTSSLAAHRARQSLIGVFPQSLVVPIKLPLNTLYPRSNVDSKALN